MSVPGSGSGSGTTTWRTLRRTADLTPQPWANGRGTTVELLRPDDGSWRLSVADLDHGGPFSPGCRSRPGR